MVPSTPLPQPTPYTWTLDQNALLFNIALEKTKSDLAHGKLRDAAKLAAMGASAITVRTRPASTTSFDKDKYTGEIPNKVKLLASQFAGLPQGEIAKIFANKFQPMNLYKLRHIRECNDMYHDQISIEEGTLQMRKVTSSYKDYGRDNAKAFLNYTMILMELFGTTTPFLHLALHRFHREIIDFSIVYEWQGGVFPLALDLHTHIVESHPTDPLR